MDVHVISRCRLYDGSPRYTPNAHATAMIKSIRLLSRQPAALSRLFPRAQNTAFLAASEVSAPYKDLDAADDKLKGKQWDSLDRWVMFSDLHVSTRSLDTCIEVLRQIRHEAVARNAGILFLGTSRVAHQWTVISSSRQPRKLEAVCAPRQSQCTQVSLSKATHDCRGLLACKRCTACGAPECCSG